MSEATAVYAPAETVAELRRLARIAGIVIAIVFGGLGAWSVFTTITGAVIASGVVKVEVNPKVIQHPDGGVVRSIHVREGQHVRRGDVLVELDDVEADAGWALVRDQLDAERARMARLAAESHDARHIDFPADLLARRQEAGVREILKREQDLFQVRQQLYREQQVNLRQQLEGAETEFHSTGEQIHAQEDSLFHLREQEKMYASLTEQKFFAPAKMLDIKHVIAESEGKRHEAESQRAQAQQKIADLRLKIDSLHANWLAESSKDLVDSQSKMFNFQERLRPAVETRERTLVRAPESGTVNLLKIHTVGGSIGPREPIIEITPDETRLVAEVRLNPNDKDNVSPGLDAEVELVGLPRRTTPLLSGKVEFVSPDLITDPANASVHYFTVRLAMSKPKNATLVPGMPVSTFIQTRRRSPLDLWLDPIVGFVRNSMRER